MPSKKNSNKTGGKNLITNCEQLNSYNAPGFIQDFHSSAVGSVSMMAGAFTGLARVISTSVPHNAQKKIRLQIRKKKR